MVLVGSSSVERLGTIASHAIKSSYAITVPYGLSSIQQSIYGTWCSAALPPRSCCPQPPTTKPASCCCSILAQQGAQSAPKVFPRSLHTFSNPTCRWPSAPKHATVAPLDTPSAPLSVGTGIRCRFSVCHSMLQPAGAGGSSLAAAAALPRPALHSTRSPTRLAGSCSPCSRHRVGTRPVSRSCSWDGGC